MAEAAKAKGNAAFTAAKYEEAIKHFTKAISLSPVNHVLYSNRSAAYASLRRYDKSLQDAQKTVEIKPDWPKGYSRLGAAYVGLGNYDDAISVYKKGLELDPTNEGLKSGLADAQTSVRSWASSSQFGNIFHGSELQEKLTADPNTRTYLEQPDFVRMIQDVQRNPNNIDLYVGDQRMMQVLGVLLNANLRTSSPEDMEKDAFQHQGLRYAKSLHKSQPRQDLEPEPEPEPMDIPEEEKEKAGKAEAQKEKEGGDAAYKKKDFETAIQHYTKAMDLDDEDISYIINRASVYMEMGKYDECIKDCDRAVERGRELQSDFKTIAWALTIHGTAYIRMAKCAKDYEPAIESFQKALTKHHNPDTLEKLNDAKKAKKDLEQREYFDLKQMESRKNRKKGPLTSGGTSYFRACKPYSCRRTTRHDLRQQYGDATETWQDRPCGLARHYSRERARALAQRQWGHHRWPGRQRSCRCSFNIQRSCELWSKSWQRRGLRPQRP